MISQDACLKYAAICQMRTRCFDLQEQTLFLVLEKVCLQAADVASQHRSDCAVYNEPAFPNGPCNCGVCRDRARLAEYENVIIPSWKREEDRWREDEANAIEFRRVLAEELDKRDATITQLRAWLRDYQPRAASTVTQDAAP